MDKPKTEDLLQDDLDATASGSLDDTDVGELWRAAWPEGYTFGKYRLIRPIGGGSSAIVYLAQDRTLGREVAVKVSRNSVEQSAKSTQRFFREAEAVAGLQHPNICQVHDIGSHEGHLFIAMSYIDGSTLSEWLETKSLNELEVVRIIRTLALVLQEAHAKGVIHRDLKPENILMNGQGEPILTDFGLALTNSSGVSARLTQPGLIVGSPAYMSPEQIRDSSNVGPSTDVYSLGVLMYQMLCGVLPFTGEIITVIRKIALDEPKPPSFYQPALSPGVNEICLKALAKEPSGRFASMSEFAAALTDVMESKQPATRNVVRPLAHIRSPRLAFWPGLAALIVLVGSFFWASRFLLDDELVESVDRPSATATDSEIRRLARLNRLLENGLQIEVETGELEAPLTEIPPRVLFVTTADYDGFDSETLDDILEVVPPFQRLNVRTDEFSPETWDLLRRSYPPELHIEADTLTAEELATIGQMTELTWLELTCPTLVDANLKAIESLTNLRTLLLPESPIDGSGLRCFAEMSHLGELDLSNSQIRDKFLPDLKHLRELEVLRLVGTPVTGEGIASLASLPNLQRLYIGDTALSNADLRAINAIPKLTHLFLEGCSNISDLAPLAGKSLAELGIGGTSVTDLSVLATMPLEDVFLQPSQVQDSSILYEIPTLVTIDGVPVDAQRAAPGHDRGSEVSRLERLNIFCARGLQLLPNWEEPLKYPLEKMPDRIWAISTLGCQLTDDELRELLDIVPPFQRLYIETDWLTSVGWNLLLRQRLRELFVETEVIDPEHWQIIGNMRELTHLEIKCDTIVDADVRAIEGLHNLTQLSFPYANINGSCLRFLAQMQRLDTLDLVSTKVRDEFLAELPALPSLKVLNLCATEIEGAGIASLARLPELRYLNVACTAVNNEALVGVRELPRLEELVLHDTPHITDLSPLVGLSLDALHIAATGVNDLSPLRSTKLTWLVLDESWLEKGGAAYFPPTLETVNGRAVAEATPDS